MSSQYILEKAPFNGGFAEISRFAVPLDELPSVLKSILYQGHQAFLGAKTTPYSPNAVSGFDKNQPYTQYFDPSITPRSANKEKWQPESTTQSPDRS